MGVMLVMRLIAHWQHCVITEINRPLSDLLTMDEKRRD